MTLQPWRAFQPDGVILFSDILTPLTAMGVPFDIDESKGPVIHHPIRSTEDLKTLRSINLSEVEYVQRALQMVCQEVRATLRRENDGLEEYRMQTQS